METGPGLSLIQQTGEARDPWFTTCQGMWFIHYTKSVPNGHVVTMEFYKGTIRNAISMLAF